MAPTLSVESIVTDQAAYAAEAPKLRARIRELRRLRRVRLGDQVALEFENAETLHYQVQEMVYAEGLTAEADVRHEVETYARLLPGSHELVATFFVELDDVGAVRRELARLAGAHRAVGIEVGGHLVRGVEIPGPDEDEPSEATVSVHFLRFRFDDEARDAFRDPSVPASLTIDHPRYADTVAIPDATRRSLLADLTLG
jgi:hypothetical protein